MKAIIDFVKKNTENILFNFIYNKFLRNFYLKDKI